jgi:hypothetical protein
MCDDGITPIGEFIGFSGYNQLLNQHKLTPECVTSTHPHLAQLAAKWYETPQAKKRR